ncbi:HNH endonuclease [Terrisporobacter sp.]|uniref:HNH endonuclease n=1 Tax=Terrisporobacter sp. TaxID=1965305 RepID=UPI002631D7D5|nr:HNH endonuclease [Terrisporobacter sp.]
MKRIEFDFNISDRYEYYITENGEVFKVDTRNGKTTECFYHIAHGYKRIRVTDIKTNIRRYIRVHRLVAMYYVHNPYPDDYNLVNHKDGDKLNNNYKNLEWCNTSMNTQHAYDNGLIKDRGGWISTPYSKRFHN